jgi:transcriptional regulator with XRE-family HTH domain
MMLLLAHGQTMPRRRKREPCDLAVDLAIRVRFFRQRLGLNPRQLAEACGLSPDQVTRIEFASRSPNTRTLRKLAAGLGVTVADLLNADTTNELGVVYEALRQNPGAVAKLRIDLSQRVT